MTFKEMYEKEREFNDVIATIKSLIMDVMIECDGTERFNDIVTIDDHFNRLRDKYMEALSSQKIEVKKSEI